MSVTVVVQRRKSLVFNLVRQIKNFTGVCITMVIIVIRVLTEKISNLKPIMKMPTFQISFVETCLKKLILLTLGLTLSINNKNKNGIK